MHSRNTAFALLSEYTKSESLIKHALAVEAAMRWYAEDFFKLPAEQVELWGITGLLHDFDYEVAPEPTPPNGHPFFGNKLLKELGYPDEVCEAIMGHAHYTGVARNTSLAKTLFAVDETCGLVMASALVRPLKDISLMEAKSVLKKFKDARFAAGCSRDDMRQGAEELGVPLDEHIGNIIQAMRQIAPELGLT
jgi:predicted hydrolase (HD superfamily)